MLSPITFKIVPSTVTRLTMSDEEYFGGAVPLHISNSKMGLINPDQGGSPEKYVNGFGSSDSPALALGSAVHALILEGDMYKLFDKVDKPTAKVGMIFDTLHKLMVKGKGFDEAIQEAAEIHEYYGGKIAGKRKETMITAGMPYLNYLQKDKTPYTICLDKAMREKLISCVASIHNNKLATELLAPTKPKDFFSHRESFNEDVIICDIELDFEDGSTMVLPLKAKIDNWSIDYVNKVLTLNDLKTTGKPVETFPGKEEIQTVEIDGNPTEILTFVKGSFQSYHYYRQMYMYGWMLWQYATEHLGVDNTWKLAVNMIVVETNKPHKSHVFNVDKRWMKAGKEEMQEILARIAYHEINGYDIEVEGEKCEMVFEIC